MDAVLTPKTVEDMYVECVHRDGELTSEMLVAPSIRTTTTFSRSRIAQHRQSIRQLLAQLPATFRQAPDGERSTLGCYTHGGRQWTQLPSEVDHLFALGVAIEAVHIMGVAARWPHNHTDPRVLVTIGSDARG